MTRAVEAAFCEALGPGRLGAQVSLSSLTTFRTGGPAEWYLETSDREEVLLALTTADDLQLPVTILGGGSNVLVAENGVRGLVIRFRHGTISRSRPGCVLAGGGVSLNGLVRWTVGRGLAGLERWAGTPGTVGGAIHGNAHFDGHLIGTQVVAVGLVDRRGREAVVTASEMRFGYDRSRLQVTHEVVLWAEFVVTEGDPETLRATARGSLAYRKQTQPLTHASAGCVFQNPPADHEGLRDGLPASAGALIERAGLKGVAIGGASVSPIHGNFIVSDGAASAHDIRELIEHCRVTVRQRFDITLCDEVIYLGEF